MKNRVSFLWTAPSPAPDAPVLSAAMSLLILDALPAGSVEGTCNILVLNQTAEDNLMSFRFKKGGTLITEDSTAALMADYGLGFEILLIMRAFGGDVEGARPRV